MGSTASAPRTLRIGDFELDLQSGELRNNGLTTRLTEQPFQILMLLLERRGEVVSREELRQRLWAADTFVDFDTGLNSAVKKLRDALGDSAERPRFIETLPRRGYRLIAPIETPRVAEPSAEARRTRIAGSNWMWAAVLVVVILSAVIVGVKTGRLTQKRTPTNAPPPIDSIAVLPLENLSADPAQEYFADGMTDSLITGLAQIRGLRVISRTSVLQYKKTRKTLPEIGRELNVDAVVEGTVTRSGSRVRITAQLVYAPTDHHLWARSYERDLIDILPLQGELAQAIAEAVEVNVAPQVRARLQSAPQLNPAAHEAFFQGRVAASEFNLGGFTKAIEHYERAVTIQPDFALAHSAIARCHYQFAFGGTLSPRQFMPRAEVAVRRALKADPSLAEAHRTLGDILYRFHWDWSGADTEFRRALALSPNDAEGHRRYADFLSLTGRPAEASAHRKVAREVDPRGTGLDSADDSDEARRGRAIEAHRKAVARNPTTRAYFQLGSRLVTNGELSEGIKALELAVEYPVPNPRFLAYLGYAYAAAGKAKEARRVLEQLIPLSRKQYVSSFGIAMVYSGLGEKQTALDRLDKAYDERAFELAQLNNTAAFDSLRSEPRFRALVKRLGLPG